jgi:hypothetical protein
MVRLVDVPLDNGSATSAIEQLTEAVKESSQQPTTRQTQVQERQVQDVDPRFAGKSTEEIVNMYRNLESHSGRLASQLGEARTNLHTVITGKRENDLRQNGGQVDTREAPKISPNDLLSNPTDAIDRYLSSRQSPEVSALQARLAQLEGQLANTTLRFNHPKAEEETADPAFAAWVRQTPLRQELAQRAANGDARSADMLLTEWQTGKAAGKDPVHNASERAKDLASRTTLEGRSSGSEGTGKAKRTFKSSDLIALRQNDPDKYENPAFQREITQAYIEKRVLLDQ